MSKIVPTPIIIPAYSDGYELHGFLLSPLNDEEHGPVVIIATATAVPCKFYIPYLSFLAENGIMAICFDYRGTNESLTGKMCDSLATAEDWGCKDLAGVIEYVSTNYPQKKLVHFGHSVGGHIMPWPHNAHKISHAITMGTQNAFYPLTPFRYRHQLFWNVVVPAASTIWGHFPGSKLQIVGDVPVEVMKEWRSWATNPSYIAGITPERRQAYKNFDKPILAISVDDDEYATRLGVQIFHQMLGAPVQFWHIEHNDVPGKRPLRHVGFFTRGFSKSLWPQTVNFIKTGILPEISDLKPNFPPTTDLKCRL